jgi:rod shape determining protein RodA
VSTGYLTDTKGRRRPVASAPARRRAGASPLRQMDWILTSAVLALAGLGGLLVWSATQSNTSLVGEDSTAYLQRHLLNLGLGLALGVAASLFNYRLLRAYAPVLYIASVLGLVAVLTPLGSVISGARSWIVLPGGFSIQPSEFAKVALVVGMAMILAEKRDAESTPGGSLVAQALALAAVPLALIMLQPDLGTALVVVFLVLGIVAVSGASARWIVGLLVLGVAVSAFALTSDVLEGYQRDRLTSFIDPNSDPQGSSYNVRQVFIAIGSGGLTGKGLFAGPQTQGSFVPAQHTDFVFSVAGEELGLIGAGGILVLFTLVFWRAYRIAVGAEDLFGRLVAVGVLCWFVFQTFENIGMCLGLMPVTGIPLPFVSYGGSSMFANLIAVGLLQNVHMKRYA